MANALNKFQFQFSPETIERLDSNTNQIFIQGRFNTEQSIQEALRRGAEGDFSFASTKLSQIRTILEKRGEAEGHEALQQDAQVLKTYEQSFSIQERVVSYIDNGRLENLDRFLDAQLRRADFSLANATEAEKSAFTPTQQALSHAQAQLQSSLQAFQVYAAAIRDPEIVALQSNDPIAYQRQLHAYATLNATPEVQEAYRDILAISSVLSEEGLDKAEAFRTSLNAMIAELPAEDLEGASDTQKFWNEAPGYTGHAYSKTGIDDEEGLGEDELAKDPSFLKASATVFEAETGQPWTGTTEELAAWGVDYMGWFNYNIPAMSAMTAGNLSGTPEQQTAFLYMMDAYDQKDITWSGTWRMAKGMAVDPSTYLGLGTLGLGLAAKEGGKAAAKEGLKATLRSAVRGLISTQARTAAREGVEQVAKEAVEETVERTVLSRVRDAAPALAVMGVEGGIYASADDAMRQHNEIAAERLDEFDVGRNLQNTAIGAGAAVALGGTVTAAVDLAPKAFNALRGNASDIADDVTVKAPDAETATPVQAETVEASDVTDTITVISSQPTAAALAPVETSNVIDAADVFTAKAEQVTPDVIEPVAPQTITTPKADNDNLEPSIEDIKMVVNGSPIQPVDAVSDIHLVVANDATPVSPAQEFNTITASAGDTTGPKSPGGETPKSGAADSSVDGGDTPAQNPTSAKAEEEVSENLKAADPETATFTPPTPKAKYLRELVNTNPEWYKDPSMMTIVRSSIEERLAEGKHWTTHPYIKSLKNHLIATGQVDDAMVLVRPSEQAARDASIAADIASANRRANGQPEPTAYAASTVDTATAPRPAEGAEPHAKIDNDPAAATTAGEADDVDGIDKANNQYLADEAPSLKITTAGNKSNMFPAPKYTWLHAYAEYRPDWYIRRNMTWLTSENVDNGAKHIPNVVARGVFGLPDYVKPFIRTIDKIIDRSNALDDIKDLASELHRVHGSVDLSPAQAKSQSIAMANDFVTRNRESLVSLSDDLFFVIEELKLEQDLLALTKTNKSPDPATNIETYKNKKFENLVKQYENTTGRTFHEQTRRLAEVQNGGQKRVSVEEHQLEAMLNYSRELRSIAQNLTNNSFIEQYTKQVNESAKGNLTDIISDPFTKIISFIQDSAHRYENKDNILVPRIAQWGKNIDPAETDSSIKTNAPWIKPRATSIAREDIFNLEVGLRYGYYNPHKRLAPINPAANTENAEKITMDIESMDLSDKGRATELSGYIQDLYRAGEEHFAIEVLQRLNDKSGKSGKRALISELLAIEARPQGETKKSPHYQYFWSIAQKHISAPHSPEIHGQRDIRRRISEATSNIQYAFKFAGDKWIATPGKITYYKDPARAIKKDLLAHLTGGKVVDAKRVADSDGNVIRKLKKDETEDQLGNGEKIKHVKAIQYTDPNATPLKRAAQGAIVIPKAAIRITTLPLGVGWKVTKSIFFAKNFALSKTLGAAVVAGGLLHGAEEGLEAYTGEEYSLDAGSRLINGSLSIADFAASPLRIGASTTQNMLQLVTPDSWSLVHMGIDATFSLPANATLSSLDNIGGHNLNPHYHMQRGILGDRGEGAQSAPRPAPPTDPGNNGQQPPTTTPPVVTPPAITGAAALRMADFNLRGASIDSLNAFHTFVSGQHLRVQQEYQRVLNDLNTTDPLLIPIANQLNQIQQNIGVPLTMPSATPPGAASNAAGQTTYIGTSVAQTVLSHGFQFDSFTDVQDIFNKVGNQLSADQRQYLQDNKQAIEAAAEYVNEGRDYLIRSELKDVATLIQ